jgi:hypothetical protein
MSGKTGEEQPRPEPDRLEEYLRERVAEDLERLAEKYRKEMVQPPPGWAYRPAENPVYLADGDCGHNPYVRHELDGQHGTFLYCRRSDKELQAAALDVAKAMLAADKDALPEPRAITEKLRSAEADCHLVRRRAPKGKDSGGKAWELMPEYAREEAGWEYACRKLRKL